jgi:hypothetical protein
MSERDLKQFLDAMEAVTHYNLAGLSVIASAYLARAEAIAER